MWFLEPCPEILIGRYIYIFKGTTQGILIYVVHTSLTVHGQIQREVLQLEINLRELKRKCIWKKTVNYSNLIYIALKLTKSLIYVISFESENALKWYYKFYFHLKMKKLMLREVK